MVADPEGHRQRARNWNRKNPDKHRSNQKAWYQRNATEVKARVRDRTYGLAPGEFDSMVEQQGGRCGGCGEPFTETPNVDHNHTTGAVRGLLCRPCNLTIGQALESPERLERLVAYLKKELR